MRARSPHEAHRVSTPLELFFDLVFVVAVAQAAAGLHHGISEAHALEALVSYAMVFFAIWWAWMNFTWFASAYDTDDVPYRLLVFVQLAGALILAAGVPRAFEERNFSIVTAGYSLMRLAQVAQWLRAARSDSAHRTTASRYALGLTVIQIGWIGLLFVPTPLRWVGFAALVAAELAVPVWAERTGATTWHPEHIVERYGLFTIIVLGESILSASLAIQSDLQLDSLNVNLLGCIFGGLLIVFAMWWLYFERPVQHIEDSLRTAFIWGYGHLLIFAAVAAVGAGLAVVVDYATTHTTIGPVAAGMGVAIPVAIFLIVLWTLHWQPEASGFSQALLPITALLVLLTPWLGQGVLLIGLLLVALLAIKLVSTYRGRESLPRRSEPAS
jgi:low temperature requirement protein LtrA